MVSSDALVLARSAVAEHRWRTACERFAEARSTAAQAVSGADLELFSTALLLRGQPRAALDELTSAHESHLANGDAAGAARTAGWLALELLEVGDVSLAGTWVARGVRLAERLEAGSTAGALVALVPAALTAMFVGDVGEALRRFDDIADVAERTDDRDLGAHAAFGRGKCLTIVGRTDEGLASLDKAMRIVAAGDVSPLTVCVLYRATLDVWHEGFDLRRAEVWTTAFAKWCSDQPELIAYSGQAHAYRAQLLLLHGNWAEASAAANRSDECLRAGDFTARYVANYQLAELHRLRGDVRAAEERYRRASQTGWDPQPGLALLRLAMGKPAAAQTMIRNSAAGADEATRRRLLPALVEIEVGAGDVSAARRTAEDLRELSEALPRPMLIAVARFAEAQVLDAEGDSAGALVPLEIGLSNWAVLDAPYEMARCLLLRARIRSALGESEAAVPDFDMARRIFTELGARPALAQVSTLTGERPASSLTGREVEVLRLVTTGLTNRGIADRLSLSEKTVARHISNIFGKLGLRSRAAATAYAYEHGLI